MVSGTLSTHAEPPTSRARRRFRNLSIGSKLTFGFGLLVSLTLIVVGLTYIASAAAARTITYTSDVRVPAALTSSYAQSHLLQMFSNVRGYLALGDLRFMRSYRTAEQDFEEDLNDLKELSVNFDAENKRRLEELDQTFQEWRRLPDTLFLLYSDQMAREPAYNWLNTTGTRHAARVLININEIIALQVQREPSRENIVLIENMDSFRSSFSAMFAGLRGYVTTRNPNFRHYEYEFNLDINAQDWQVIAENQQRFTSEQQALLEEIRTEREQMIAQVPTQIFAVVESDQWRADLYLFDTELEPRTARMQQLLLEIMESQQETLRNDLAWGSANLNQTRSQALGWGVVATLLGIGMALGFWRMITQPVQRLTVVAQQIEGGDLSAKAPVDSHDEIGIFARTFNRMTAQLRQTFAQISHEKKRADDLLDIVIPIGVALSSERDFNRLLENMLVEAMAYCRADGGAIFLRDGQVLKLMMLRITSQNAFLGGTTGEPIVFPPLPLDAQEIGAPEQRNPVSSAVIRGEPVNIPDAHAASTLYDIEPMQAMVSRFNYQPVSLLAIPLNNTRNEVLGVMQLINAQQPETNEIIPFDTNLQRMMVSFSSLAVAALESYIREQSLRQEIQQLRIQIDESKQQQQVSEIVESDFFQDLQARARTLRQRNKGEKSRPSEDTNQV